MTGEEQELINRYIYEVTQRVRQEQRREIEMELEELIADMAEENTVEEVLKKLGDPAKFAEKYREDSHYVIGPEYYDNYLWVMKIVLACTWGGLLVAMLVECSIVNPENVLYELAKFMGELISASFAAFGTVTFIFALMERQKIHVDLKQEKAWTPKMLSPIPQKAARISRGDCIAGIIFIILFGCVMAFAPQLIGIYRISRGDEIVSVSVLNLKSWDVILPFLLVALGVGLIDEVVRLILGCYCKVVMYCSIFTNIVQIGFGFLVLKVLPIWNIDFVQELKQQITLVGELKLEKAFLKYWNGSFFSDIILLIMLVACFIEVGITVYKTLRYGRNSF